MQDALSPLFGLLGASKLVLEAIQLISLLNICELLLLGLILTIKVFGLGVPRLLGTLHPSDR